MWSSSYGTRCFAKALQRVTTHFINRLAFAHAHTAIAECRVQSYERVCAPVIFHLQQKQVVVDEQSISHFYNNFINRFDAKWNERTESSSERKKKCEKIIDHSLRESIKKKIMAFLLPRLLVDFRFTILSKMELAPHRNGVNSKRP